MTRVILSSEPIANHGDFTRWVGGIKTKVAGRIYANLDRAPLIATLRREEQVPEFVAD